MGFFSIGYTFADPNGFPVSYDTCRADQSTCSNKKCFQSKWERDQNADCDDGSDEKDYCITCKWRCDGDYDRPDHSYEFCCKNSFTDGQINHCAEYEFICEDFLTCFHRSVLIFQHELFDNQCVEGLWNMEIRQGFDREGSLGKILLLLAIGSWATLTADILVLMYED